MESCLAKSFSKYVLKRCCKVPFVPLKGSPSVVHIDFNDLTVKRESISYKTSYSELDLSIRKGKKTDIVVFESLRERTSHSFESLAREVLIVLDLSLTRLILSNEEWY